MAWKSKLILPFAKRASAKLLYEASHAIAYQEKIMQALVRQARDTQIGRELGFDTIRSYTDFKNQIPIRDYERMRLYIDAIVAGKSNILWPGRPRYFAKSSGTTSGVKYIPITADSIPNHIGSARYVLFNYAAHNKDASIFDGKMIFLSGSPVLEMKGDIPNGRLSGIVNHLIPRWIKSNQLPTYETNCIDNWGEKVDRIVEESLRIGSNAPVPQLKFTPTHGGERPVDMRLISGIPPWVQMYYERLISASGKSTVCDIFPNYSLFVYGGVNYIPYASKLEELVGRHIDSLETYPTSEGFIAYQDSWPYEGLRLNINSGIFFEFVATESLSSANPDRLSLQEVELNKDYAVIINSNAGLWGYDIGDTVQFVSKDPYRIVVSGRVEHFISAFGEHVIAKEVEQTMSETCVATGIHVTEFTVAPQVNPPDGGAPYHEWFIEFDGEVNDLTVFRDKLEASMRAQNIYYRDLREGNVLRPLVITLVQKDRFRKYMESMGKLGGQNKLPRLKNDRGIAERLTL
ncbi:MAG TPA: GH3 auxin-responsive promoter family protein [Saprospiraceae bacterium]|nr:GH3 auxin-responsive promoter family protein [Saprospiraceae bacterium]